ncbi:MAG: hypothetical protein ACP5HG_15395 [Anaerolineae bacterium]
MARKRKAPYRYDPDVGPDPEAWLALDELERIERVRRYHRRARIELPNEQLHAILHATVEAQAADGDETPVAETLERLMDEGLTRHDAIHAVASVLIGHIHNLMMATPSEGADPNIAYFREVRELTAQKWYTMYEEGED